MFFILDIQMIHPRRATGGTSYCIALPKEGSDGRVLGFFPKDGRILGFSHKIYTTDDLLEVWNADATKNSFCGIVGE